MKASCGASASTTSNSRRARALAHLLGQESHARSAGALPAIRRSQDREDRAYFRGISQGIAKANALDFDDLLLEAVRLLKASAAVREYYNRRFQYLLIDEYQDTNRPQYELMRMLAGERHNVCAVGDEDQSIYSWRGADIRNILEFEKDFPEAKIIRLEQNYRSTQNILQAASAVVANNLQAQRQKSLDLAPGRHQDRILRSARRRKRSALRRRPHLQISARSRRNTARSPRAAVLYRTNSQSRLFEEAMRRYRLKYHVVGGFSFYERAEIKDMISYLKVIHNPDDSISLLRVINTPTRGIGKTRSRRWSASRSRLEFRCGARSAKRSGGSCCRRAPWPR